LKEGSRKAEENIKKKNRKLERRRNSADSNLIFSTSHPISHIKREELEEKEREKRKGLEGHQGE
jgi:hypothetical protein